MFNLEKLEVWQEAIDLAGNAYTVTRHFPEEERFGLTSQMRRAAVSGSSNIAEGSAYEAIYAAAEEQSRRLSGLRKSLARTFHGLWLKGQRLHQDYRGCTG